MAPQDLRAFAQRYFEALDKRDLNTLYAMFHPTSKTEGFAPVTFNRDQVKQAMIEFFSAFPDSRMPTDDIICEGDLVAIRHSFIGTHKESFQGVPPSGKKVTVPAIIILKVNNNQVMQAWLNADFLGLMQQIGAIPSAATA